MKKPLSKEELIARLKAIAADTTPKKQIFGAMCYSQMSPPEKRDTCQMCGTEFVYRDWHTKENITKMVNKMISLGYDVKIKILCSECGDKMVRQLYPDCRYCNPQKKYDRDCFFNTIWPDDINFLFFFRTKSDEPYHQALC